jgi:hypothetical protein
MTELREPMSGEQYESMMDDYDAANAYYENRDRHDSAGCRLGTCKLGEDDSCPEIWFIDCFECGPNLASHPEHIVDPITGFQRWDNHAVKQLVVANGPVIAQNFDPTQTYRLACGHTSF